MNSLYNTTEVLTSYGVFTDDDNGCEIFLTPSCGDVWVSVRVQCDFKPIKGFWTESQRMTVSLRCGGVIGDASVSLTHTHTHSRNNAIHSRFKETPLKCH